MDRPQVCFYFHFIDDVMMDVFQIGFISSVYVFPKGKADGGGMAE